MDQNKNYKGLYCCVVGCNSSYPKDRESVRFFCFSRKNFEQRELWIKAVHRKNVDGTDWSPKVHTRVCSKHFIGEKPSPTRTHPDYVPSIFPTNHLRARKAADCERHDRFMNRRKVFPGSCSGLLNQHFGFLPYFIF